MAEKKVSWFMILVLVAAIAFIILKAPSQEKRISPSDIICSTIAQCSVGETNFSIGDMVSSPKYRFGFHTGEIIIMDPEELTATVKWSDGGTSTEPLSDLNKLKSI